MIKFKVNILARNFSSEDEARRFSSFDYSVDIDNPECQLIETLGGMDINLDYVETIWGSDHSNYLNDLLVKAEDVDNVIQKSSKFNTLIIIMELEDNRNLKMPPETGDLTNCGRYLATFKDF